MASSSGSGAGETGDGRAGGGSPAPTPPATPAAPAPEPVHPPQAATAADAPAPPPVPTASSSNEDRTMVADKYQEIRQIGTGAYGTVYFARDRGNLERVVALKKIRITLTEDGVPVSAIREISLLKQLERFEHPNIVRDNRWADSGGHGDSQWTPRRLNTHIINFSAVVLDGSGVSFCSGGDLHL
ncbi:hypothetical protein Pmani_038706 [Petrolisthes manimaculis]|uniref:cyclin-dependent kinase n=1 Tax=Petrolisthes manimaculis TaxID=1843537 RepID=A0AAE1TK04_9EUCA|nr:hypothetical protein Pmani_038706 [Petrolisthes manimaculis]